MLIVFAYTSCEKSVDYSADISALKSAVVGLQKTVDSLNTALNVTNRDLFNVTKSIDSIRTKVNTIVVQIDLLTTQLNTATVNISDISKKIIDLQTQLNSLTAQLNVLSASQKKYFVAVNYLDYSKAELIDTTQWHYVALLFYPDRRNEIFIDGIKKVDFYRANVAYNYSKFYLGASFYTAFSAYYKGALDELRVSNIVRSQKEIQDYYIKAMGTTDGVLKVGTQQLDASTIGLWHFDEASGTILTNSVTNASNGILTSSCKFMVGGKSGNALYFNGIDSRGDCNINIPESPLTIEFWFKSSTPGGVMVQPYGVFSTDIHFVMQ